MLEVFTDKAAQEKGTSVVRNEVSNDPVAATGLPTLRHKSPIVRIDLSVAPGTRPPPLVLAARPMRRRRQGRRKVSM